MTRFQFAEQAKDLRAKRTKLAKPDMINPNLIEISAAAERFIHNEKQQPKDPIPDVEWWDVPIVGGIIADEDKLKLDKITLYIQYPVPIEPPAERAQPPPQPLILTKQEKRKLGTQTRLRRELDRQANIRDGLIPPPNPKVKLTNFMKLLGSEAAQEPTKLEVKIRSAAAMRQQAHFDRNTARSKSTPRERLEKKERKLFDDPNSQETLVSLYRINDLSHPQTRVKVKSNARENRLTGCAVNLDGISIVVVEGGRKSITRFGKLMIKRINWDTAAVMHQHNEDEEKPVNKCMLVWQGSVAKTNFNSFTVHDCRTEEHARKVLSDAGAIHYWDSAVN